MCLRQLVSADLSTYRFFTKQLFLLDIFRCIDYSIYKKYLSRFSSLLWNLSVSFVSKKEVRSSFYSVAATSLLMGLSVSESSNLNTILDHLLIITSSLFSKRQQNSSIQLVYKRFYSSFPQFLQSLSSTQEFRFYFYWSRVGSPINQWKQFVAKITRSSHTIGLIS